MKQLIVALTIALCACASLNRASTAPDDSAIRDEARAYLSSDGFDSVDVTVDRGVVTLKGHLASNTFREKAVSDAEKPIGVKRVVNKIEVP
jgi:osmotically-inducible protein OsmY